MTVENAILRAYALASQYKYHEAEDALRSVDGAMSSLHGADLYARILCATGRKDSARGIWEEILHVQPDNEAAKLAIQSLDAPVAVDLNGVSNGIAKNYKIVIAAVLALGVGFAFSLGKHIGGTVPAEQPEVPTILAETTVGGKISGKILKELEHGFLTNLTENCALVIKGGSGKYITDRQKRLAVLADCIKEATKIPISQMYFQPGDESADTYTLQIVPCWGCKKDDTGK